MAKWTDVDPRDTSPAWARLVREARRRDSTTEATLTAALDALARVEPRITTGVGAPPPEESVERLPVLHSSEVESIGRILAEPSTGPTPALVDAVRRYREREEEE